MPSLPRYLGLDLSTHTGWALVEGSRLVGSGVRDFSTKSSPRIGMRGIKFYNFLHSIGHVDEIYYEKIQFNGGFKGKNGKWVNVTADGRELYHGLLMVMHMFADGYNDIPCYGVHPNTLKKNFTGNGRAEKKEMCARAHELGWKGGEIGTALFHDEVDAIAILETELRLRRGIQISF